MKQYRLACAPLMGLLALLALPALAQAQYMWLDDKGLKQLSDQPPPPSVPQNRILKQPRGQGGNAALPAAPAAASPTASAATSAEPAPEGAEAKVKRPPTLAERNAEFAKRKAESQAAEQKAAQEAAQQAERSANCDAARSNQAALNSGNRMTEYDKNGERTFLTDEQRAERAKRAQKTLANCSK
jgi:type IV secretory pathway VirB10-like protein